MSVTRPEKLKELMRDKGKVVNIPENGDAAVICKEVHDPDTKKVFYEIGVGKVWGYNRYFDIVGFSIKDLAENFQESSVRTQVDEITKPRPEKPVLVATFPPSFQRTVDENRWEDKFRTVDDLIRILDEL
ncbi:MAG: hypothetical protein ACTSU5_13335 [Promethearchaeota archaeon]